ncbi:CsxC family protein [Neobacillus sp. 179-C4.2 HS]|uniref:CsxC family protein n=1 Tax=Neobacillus driksii TaxID=3035913 RepID=A0ABV4YUK8_9BACI
MCKKNDQVQPLVCPVVSDQQGSFNDSAVNRVLIPSTATLKVPVVLAERTLQIVVEANVPLNPAATEIKRVHKNAQLTQVKLVPVAFTPIPGTNFFNVTRAKLFVAGTIRKNIEYASVACNAPLVDRIATIPFSGFVELTAGDFLAFPILAASSDATVQFLDDKDDLSPRFDKYFFQNQVNYNEQPYGELIRANFFELDFSPNSVRPGAGFNLLREKIVLDLTLKVLQVQQFEVEGNRVIPSLTNGIVGPGN